MAVWFRAGFDLFDLCRTLSCDYASRARERLWQHVQDLVGLMTAEKLDRGSYESQ